MNVVDVRILTSLDFFGYLSGHELNYVDELMTIEMRSITGISDFII